jgi:hypothetical protein
MRDLRPRDGAGPRSRTCEWYRVRDGKVAAVSVIFDARPFAPLFEHRE